MSSTPTTSNRFNLQGTGDNVDTWGAVLNQQVFTLVDQSLDGVTSISVSGTVAYTLSAANYTPDQARNRIQIWNGNPGGNFIVTAPSVSKSYIIHNKTAYTGTIKTATGTGVDVISSCVQTVYTDGADFYSDIPISYNNQRIQNVGAPVSGTDAARYQDITAAVSGLPLSTWQAATNDLNIGGYRIKNMGNAAAATDAVTLAQLNNAIAGITSGASQGTVKISAGDTTSKYLVDAFVASLNPTIINPGGDEKLSLQVDSFLTNQVFS